DSQRFDDVDIRLYPSDGTSPALFDLRRDLAGAQVHLDDLACNQARSEGGFACPGAPGWSYVGPHTLRVDGKAWPCVWAHPTAHKQVIIDLGERELGKSVVLEAALSDPAATDGAPVQLFLDLGADTHALTRTPQRGVARLEVTTTPGEHRTVRVRITTEA